MEPPITKLAFIGTGSFGFTMAVVAAHGLDQARNPAVTTMWVRRDELCAALRQTRVHPDYDALADVPLPGRVELSTSLREVLADASHIVFAVPSRFALGILEEMQPYVASDVSVLSLVKGFYLSGARFTRMSELIAATLQLTRAQVCSLGGPNTYSEIASNFVFRPQERYRPCNIVVSGHSRPLAETFAGIYRIRDVIKPFVSDDLVAAEVGGALKNPVALLSGVADAMYEGRGMGVNFKASMLARAWFEVAHFARALGGDREKLYGVAGLGDLLATSFAGRSHSAGRLIGAGLSVDDVRAEMVPHEIEAFQTLSVMWTFLQELRASNPDVLLELPILEETYRIVFERKSFFHAVRDVINRPLRGDIRNDPYLRE